MGKNIVGFLLTFIVLLCGLPTRAYAAEDETSIGIEAPHAVLMEASTGTILYEKDAHIALTLSTGEAVTVDLEDIDIFSEDIPGWSVANEGTLTVALDLNITESLRLEGVARELIRSIQALRKSSNFEITDRIIVTLPNESDNELCLKEFKEYIATQVLANEVVLGEKLSVEKV